MCQFQSDKYTYKQAHTNTHAHIQSNHVRLSNKFERVYRRQYIIEMPEMQRKPLLRKWNRQCILTISLLNCALCTYFTVDVHRHHHLCINQRTHTIIRFVLILFTFSFHLLLLFENSWIFTWYRAYARTWEMSRQCRRCRSRRCCYCWYRYFN